MESSRKSSVSVVLFSIAPLNLFRGVEVWRIEKFKVVPWPKERFGRFYSGDSYIILRTYYKTPEDKKFSFDVHFWLGKDTSQDEAGTAAYKTVELDDLLGGVPVQHREVQDHESELFLSYFPKFHAEDGGVETGFKHVKPAEYRSRLLQVKGVKTRVVVREVEKSYKSLNSGDVFLLDAGMTVMQWNGVNSNPQERRKGAEFSYGIQQERNGTPKITVYSTLSEIKIIISLFINNIGEGDGDLADFWQLLGGEGKVTSGAAAGNDGAATNAPKRLFRLTDTSGRADFKEENTNGKVRKSHFDTKDGRFYIYYPFYISSLNF